MDHWWTAKPEGFALPLERRRSLAAQGGRTAHASPAPTSMHALAG